MKKTVLLLLFVFITLQAYSQSVEEKVEKLLQIDGTLRNIENVIDRTIEYQKNSNPTIFDSFWKNLEEKVKKESLEEFTTLVTPIYTKTYTEEQIDAILTMLDSEVGKLLVETQPNLLQELSLPIQQWSQNTNAYIIKQIENRGNTESTSEELEDFEKDFKSKYGLQILNLEDFSIDREHNVGSLLVDFGKVDGKENVVKVLRVKNNSDEEITFEKPFFLMSDDVEFYWGSTPIAVGETRDLHIILNIEKAEGNKFFSFSIRPSLGNNIRIGIKYDVPRKELELQTSSEKLKFKQTKKELSKPYIFKIKNTGKKDFYISDIEVSQPIVYLNYSKEVIKTDEEIEIRVIFSKEMIEKYNIEEVELDLKVSLNEESKGDRFGSFGEKIISFTIE
ncbi:hypothetical protein Fleli_4080 [Bernardetia litoralis DSM 6794]|uniref:DUF2059 domain-containing protein n=1 Tax=Bernardetia litoralis (strain ATCC 23117 / DSM 6794 / NBRC 15988 / NCIMB 1366 / Fx l1 / Sio-4) TaxID=880071 RepID=I4AQZ1_BERLS|nr:DUF1573 domain-containing protein [Bernardetia litoralis]AFM06376.1 hypothetical protein Fleli_4080 [Bernardetia litoralis DSM 6794]